MAVLAGTTSMVDGTTEGVETISKRFSNVESVNTTIAGQMAAVDVATSSGVFASIGSAPASDDQTNSLI